MYIEKGANVVSFLVMLNESIKFPPTEVKSLHIYKQQIRKSNQNPEDKKAVIETEAKL